jgi:hypothetical protein
MAGHKTGIRAERETLLDLALANALLLSMQSRYTPAFSAILAVATLALGLVESKAATLPTGLDLDVEIQAVGTDPVSELPWTDVIAEGWLHVVETGTSAKYKGMLTDDLSNGASLAASINAQSGTDTLITVATRYGPVTLQSGTTFLTSTTPAATTVISKSARLGVASHIYLYARTHAYTTLTYSLNFQTYTGQLGVRADQDGTLTLICDANNYIVPKDPYDETHSTLSIPGVQHPTVTNITSPGYFGENEVSGGGAGYVNLIINYFGKYYALGGPEVVVSTFMEDPASLYSGQVFASGASTAGAIGTFTMEEDVP